MSASALNFTYRYPWASGVVPSPQAQTLQLATSSSGNEHPHFFHGRRWTGSLPLGNVPQQA